MPDRFTLLEFSNDSVFFFLERKKKRGGGGVERVTSGPEVGSSIPAPHYIWLGPSQ